MFDADNFGMIINIFDVFIGLFGIFLAWYYHSETRRSFNKLHKSQKRAKSDKSRVNLVWLNNPHMIIAFLFGVIIFTSVLNTALQIELKDKNEELTLLLEDLKNKNEQLSKIHATVSEKNEELKQTHERLTENNQQLSKTKEKLLEALNIEKDATDLLSLQLKDETGSYRGYMNTVLSFFEKYKSAYPDSYIRANDICENFKCSISSISENENATQHYYRMKEGAEVMRTMLKGFASDAHNESI